LLLLPLLIILLHQDDLLAVGHALLLLGDDLLPEFNFLGVFEFGLLFILLSLVRQHRVAHLLVPHAGVLLLLGHHRSLVVELVAVHQLQVLVSLELALLQGLVHFVLMLDDCSPFVVHHFLLLYGQVPFEGRTSGRSVHGTTVSSPSLDSEGTLRSSWARH